MAIHSSLLGGNNIQNWAVQLATASKMTTKLGSSLLFGKITTQDQIMQVRSTRW